jgi:hypothetical protein
MPPDMLDLLRLDPGTCTLGQSVQERVGARRDYYSVAERERTTDSTQHAR